MQDTTKAPFPELMAELRAEPGGHDPQHLRATAAGLI